MINLLPPQEKINLSWEIKKRTAIILWCLAVLFVVFIVLILLASRFYLDGLVECQEVSLRQVESRVKQSEFQDLQAEFGVFDEALLKLDVFYKNKSDFSEILEKVSAILPQDVYLTGISINPLTGPDSSGFLKVAISGFIPSRDELFEFKKKVESQPGIKNVFFPPANWIKPVDIDFSINFNIAK